MATNESSAFQGSNVYIAQFGWIGTGAETALPAMTDSATFALWHVVPADGAELVELTYTITVVGTATTSSTMEWSISDGTNALATLAATTGSTAVDTVLTLVMGSATNGKNLATTAGTMLVLTHTEAGTLTAGPAGIFRAVWAL